VIKNSDTLYIADGVLFGSTIHSESTPIHGFLLSTKNQSEALSCTIFLAHLMLAWTQSC
jgi:hypothetical protein